MNEQGLETVFGIIAAQMGNGELEKVMYSFLCDLQSLFPALASTV